MRLSVCVLNKIVGICTGWYGRVYRVCSCLRIAIKINTRLYPGQNKWAFYIIYIYRMYGGLMEHCQVVLFKRIEC